MISVGIAAALGLSGLLAISPGLGPGLLSPSAGAVSTGSLSVTSSPAIPTQLLVDGNIADSWSLAGVELPAGTHTLSFTHVAGYSEPPAQSVTITAGKTTSIVGAFSPRGTLRITTKPSVASQISVDGNPADDAGVWTDLPPGSHQVCFGAVAGYTPPPCQTATVTAGTETDITGTFTATAGAPGQTGKGTLRVTTTPTVPSDIMITPQGGSPYTADTWGLNWLELNPGTYTVAFSHVIGYTEPPPKTITVTAGQTSTVVGTFTPRGTLRVSTSPAVGGTITLDSNPADGWGVWTDVPTGDHQVCFGAVSGYTAPPCQTATVTAGGETDITGSYAATGGGGGSGSGCVFASAAPGDTPAFCDTFSEGQASNPSNAREGGLSSVVWGVSRDSGNENLTSPANGWQPTSGDCGATNVVPPNDVAICNGQLQDAVSDGGTVTALAMYPKQPFDFAGRTGTVVFDVSDDSQGSHAAWPEFWMSDQPLPDPFTHEGLGPLPRNGFGIRFAACTTTTCGVDSAVVVRNYVANDSFQGQGLTVRSLGTVTKSSGPGQLNHFEVRVSQNQIDVYGTNAYSGPLNLSNTPLLHIASIPNANLSFTRGLVWIEDVHYNGNKFGTQGTHTFSWNNVGFDGPILPRDLGFDVPDNKSAGLAKLQNGASGPQLGYNVPANSSVSLTVPNVSGVESASGALLVFNFWHLKVPPFTLNYSVNGTPFTEPWPYPDDISGEARSLAIPVPLADLHDGSNTVTFATGAYVLNIFNVSLIMQGAGGIVDPSS